MATTYNQTIIFPLSANGFCGVGNFRAAPGLLVKFLPANPEQYGPKEGEIHRDKKQHRFLFTKVSER